MKNKLDKLKTKLSELESKLFDERLKENENFNKKGFGYAQRHAKLGNASTQRGERLRNQIADIKNQMSEIDTDTNIIDYNDMAIKAWLKQFGTEYNQTL